MVVFGYRCYPLALLGGEEKFDVVEEVDIFEVDDLLEGVFDGGRMEVGAHDILDGHPLA